LPKVAPNLDSDFEPSFTPTEYANLTDFGLSLCNKDFRKWVANTPFHPTPEIKKDRAVSKICKMEYILVKTEITL